MKSEMGPGRELKGTGGFVAGPRVASSSLVRLRGKLGETRQGLEGWVLGEEEWQASGQWFSDRGVVALGPSRLPTFGWGLLFNAPRSLARHTN